MSRPFRRAVALGGGVLLTGFGALALMWAAGMGEQSLRGLFDYRSATVGDGLLLPTTAVALAVLLGHLTAGNGLRAAVTLGVVGALAGAATQMLWLGDPSPEPNWTLPRAHHFTFPGWWHAAFLTAASGLMTGLWALVLLRLRRVGDPERATVLCSQAWAIAVGGLLGTIALVLRDNEGAAHTQAGTATYAGVAAAAVTFGVLLTLTVGLRPLAGHPRGTVAGAILGLGVIAAAWSWPVGAPAVVFGAAVILVGVALTAYRRRR
jgi:hypothetical protein